MFGVSSTSSSLSSSSLASNMRNRNGTYANQGINSNNSNYRLLFNYPRGSPSLRFEVIAATSVWLAMRAYACIDLPPNHRGWSIEAPCWDFIIIAMMQNLMNFSKWFTISTIEINYETFSNERHAYCQQVFFFVRLRVPFRESQIYRWISPSGFRRRHQRHRQKNNVWDFITVSTHTRRRRRHCFEMLKR